MAVVAGPAVAAPGGPDLSVRSVGALMPNPARGGPLAVSVQLRNTGRAVAGPSVVRFFLSADKRLSGSDWRLAGQARVRRCEPGRPSPRSVG